MKYVMARPAIRDSELRITLRIESSLEKDLRILYSIDKRKNGKISWNNWLCSILSGHKDGRIEQLEAIKKRIAELRNSFQETN